MLDKGIKRGFNYIVLFILILSLVLLSGCGETCSGSGKVKFDCSKELCEDPETDLIEAKCKYCCLPYQGVFYVKNDCDDVVAGSEEIDGIVYNSCDACGCTVENPYEAKGGRSCGENEEDNDGLLNGGILTLSDGTVVECPVGCAEEDGKAFCIRCFDDENMKIEGNTITVGQSVGIGEDWTLPNAFHKGSVVYAEDIDNGEHGERVAITERCITINRVDEFSCTESRYQNEEIGWVPLYVQDESTEDDLPGVVYGNGCDDGALYSNLANPPAELACTMGGGQRCDPDGNNRRIQYCLYYDVNEEMCLPCFKGGQRNSGPDCGGCESNPFECMALAGCTKEGAYCKNNPSEDNIETVNLVASNGIWNNVQYTIWENYPWTDFQICTAWMKPKCNLIINALPCNPYYKTAWGGGSTGTWGSKPLPVGGDVDIMGRSSLCHFSSPFCPSGKKGGCRYGDVNEIGCSINKGDWNDEGDCCDSNFYDDFTGILYKEDGSGNAQPDPDCARIAGNNICDATDYSYLDAGIVRGHPRYLLHEYTPGSNRGNWEFLESIKKELFEGGSWLDGIDDPIRKLKCNEITYLFDTENWLPAEGSCNIVTVNDHEFMDIKNDFNYWAECAGNDQPYNYESTGGKTLTTGEMISCGDITYFCSYDSKFIDDLDKDKEACEAAGYIWIGPSTAEGGCCGDDGFYDTFSLYQPYGDACFRGEILSHCYEIKNLNKITNNFGVLNKKIGLAVGKSQATFSNLLIMDKPYGKILYKANFSEDNFQVLSGSWITNNGKYTGSATNFGISIIPYNLTNKEVIEFTLDTNKNGLITFGIQDAANFWYAAIRQDINRIELGQVINTIPYSIVNETIQLPQEVKATVTIQNSQVTLLINLEDQDGSVINENGMIALCSNQGENYCETRCNQYYCSYSTTNWEHYYGEPKNHQSTWPGVLPENGIPTECCEPSKCWNGTTCISDQSNDPKAKPHETYRCINGIWIDALTKYTWDFKEDGFCPETTQCLVNPYSTNTDLPSLQFIDIDNPLNNDIQCINNEEYIGDHYCENGLWTTRTKLIALQLLDIVENSYNPDNFVLFCDNYINTLNYYDYEIVTNYGTNKAYDYIIEQLNKCELLDKPVPCVNKFCILKFKKTETDYGVAIGASLNNEIDKAGNYSILELFSKPTSYCDNIKDINDGQFHYCDPSHDTWYNNKIKAIIYSKDLVDLNQIVFWNKFIEFLKNPFTNIFDKILNIIKPEYPGGAEFDYNFIKNTKDFNRLYVSRAEDKSIYGVMEYIKDKEFLAVEYQGFTANICTSIDNYWMKDPNNGVISCNITDNNYYVETLSASRMDTWQYLTSKLRVR